jgi:SAM-dependent methyltransferase
MLIRTGYSALRQLSWAGMWQRVGQTKRKLWSLSFTSFAECRCLLVDQAEELHRRRLHEEELEGQLGAVEEGAFVGECWVCSRKRTFLYDRKYSDGAHVNWRERLVCSHCGLNNRLRLCVQVIERMASRGASMYLTEQVTPLAACLTRRYSKLVKSEYLGDGLTPGSVDARGIRHEDVTALSFGDRSFDCVLSFDVLEHVPDYRAALAEFGRVLKDNGSLILSAPFGLLSEKNLVRARLTPSGDVEHLLPPEYHGDPVDPQEGILCYYHFGWELVEELKAMGFRDARVDAYWSYEYGHIGSEQLVIIAIK